MYIGGVVSHPIMLVDFETLSLVFNLICRSKLKAFLSTTWRNYFSDQSAEWFYNFCDLGSESFSFQHLRWINYDLFGCDDYQKRHTFDNRMHFYQLHDIHSCCICVSFGSASSAAMKSRSLVHMLFVVLYFLYGRFYWKRAVLNLLKAKQ